MKSNPVSPGPPRPPVRAPLGLGILLLLTLSAGLISACGATNRPVTLAASSLTDVAPALADQTGLAMDFVFAGSPTLVTQLDHGITAAAIVTANPQQMDRALATGRLSPPIRIASNTLVIAVAPGNPGRLRHLADLADPDALVGRCAPTVPCGLLADHLLTSAGLTLTAATEEPGARSLATKLSLGELDAGLIYRTDALAFGLATIDDEHLADLGPFTTHYLAAVIDDHPIGGQLVDALVSPAGQKLLENAGFTP